jgi:hypothetical protein
MHGSIQYEAGFETADRLGLTRFPSTEGEFSIVPGDLKREPTWVLPIERSGRMQFIDGERSRNISENKSVAKMCCDQ